MFYPGYAEALAIVPTFTREDCIDCIESLWGWDWGDDGIPEYAADTVTVERLREEVRRQMYAEWEIPAGHLHHYPDAEHELPST